jgi:hypothetical protein
MIGPTRALVRLLVLAALVLTMRGSAAADTGTISGTVFDGGGEPIADAVVSVSSDHMPAARTVLTGTTGFYRFDYLPAGNYRINAAKDQLTGTARDATVELDRDTQVDFVIGVALTEQVTVTTATPIVDTRSTEVSVNMRADAINALPLERTYRGLFQLIPGVADNRSPIGPAAGGSRQDNTYLIDGANITNPGFGYLSTEINELDVAEVNLKRAGISAEFGRASGSVTNVVSRSGSNRFSGVGRIDWLPAQLVGAYALPAQLIDAGIKPGTFRDPLLKTELAPALGIGGPLLRDRVFFYGSGRFAREAKWDRSNKVGDALPDEISTTRELFGKITAMPVPSEQVNVSYRHRPSHVDSNGLDSTTAPSIATNTDNGSRIASADFTHFLTTRMPVNVRYLYMRENNEDVPVLDLAYLPPFDPGALAAMGQYTDPAQADLKVGGNQFTNIQNYRRHEIHATIGRLLDIFGGSHSLKAGIGYEFGEETFNRIANGWGLIAAVTQNGVPALRTRYFTPQPPQLGQGSTSSLFIQDEAAVSGRLSVNAGILINRDQFSQRIPGGTGCPATIALQGGAAVYESHGDTCTFLRFGFGDEVQPRLGVSYQPRSGRGDKAYANWGRYYNMDQKSAARSLAPNRIFQTQTIFDLSGRVLSSGPLASTTGKLIDPDIQPIFTDEVVIGYATPLAGRYSLDVFVMARTMNRMIEDLPSRLNGTAPDSGPFVAANLPCTRFAACRGADAERTYRAMTIDLRRPLANRWTADINYTWSRFAGNFDLDYSQVSVFNTSSFIQDGPGTNVQDPNRFGPLLEDRPHLFKIFVAYAPASRFTASTFLRVQSGTPWNARARDWPGAIMNYLEPAGSHRNPTWTNLDLMGSYRLLDGETRVSLEARLLNVFNDQTQLSTDSQQYLDLRTLSAPPYFQPYQQLNPFFGTGNGFAPPRRLQLAAVFSF